MKLRRKIFWFIILIFFAFFSRNVFAAAIKISPAKIDRLVKPGDVLNLNLNIFNDSNGSRTFRFYIRDFMAGDEHGSPILVPPGSNDAYTLASWIKITNKEVVLGPRQEQKIPFKIIVPNSASPGAHYGAIIISTTPPNLKKLNAERGAVVGVSQQVGSLILLNVLGKINERAILLNFDTNKNFYSTPFDVKFSVQVKNQGNVLIKPRGVITITNIFGKKVKVISVNEKGSNILPGTIRILGGEWRDKFAFGKYTASLALSFGIPSSKGGTGKQSLYGQTSFWIIPLKIAGYGFGGLIVLLIIFVISIRMYKNRVVEKVLKEAGVEKVVYVKKYKNGSPGLHLSIVGLIIILGVIFIILALGTILFFFLT